MHADSVFEQAVSLHRQGRTFQADALCMELLRATPRHFAAWHLRGLIAISSGNLEEGMGHIRHSLRINPQQPAAHSNIGNALLSCRRFPEALTCFDHALRLKSDFADALYNRGNALRGLERLPEALDSYERALKVRPDSFLALNNHGLTLLALGRVQEALDSFTATLRLAPDHADALVNRAEALKALGRREEALLDLEAALRLAPDSVSALNDYGNLLLLQYRAEQALQAYERALVLEPDDLGTLSNRGTALLALHRPRAALESFDQAARLGKLGIQTLIGRAQALAELGRHLEAAECLEEVLRTDPARDFVAGEAFEARLIACDWTRYEQNMAELTESLAAGARVVQPFSLLAMTDSARAQLDCGRIFTASAPAAGVAFRHAAPYRHERIRVAYVSPDLREHAVSYLMAGVFEQHDRKRFETIAISLSRPENSPMGRRVAAAFGEFVDASGKSDRDVAALIRAREVDIAVDLMGFTDMARLGVFASRSAPVQVNYLGFPGTAGCNHFDYILADTFVIPPKSQPHYAEQVVYLPDCFQANDDRRAIGPTPTRAQAGLPDKGVVLCCFNSSVKLNPAMFGIWCRVLQAVDDAVLWLAVGSEPSRENLRREAARRGVDPGRLIMTERRSYADHLGRLGLADLFVDTVPFNAGATASDALWAGVPILTCVGEAFAARMGGSLLRTVGLPELITYSLDEYEARALELARAPDQLAALKQKLVANRTRSPLFDTMRFCRHLESAYVRMWERAELGEPPVGFNIE